jgi:4-aminobutyrate aminotransferase / (S)-3-amino-2-methylpropionate transaminase
MATPYFYRQLRKISKENNIPFIVDETKTGLGSTGKMWALEHWNL